ncbi:MAG: fumarate hydratase [Eubacteriales bacterium]
MAVVFVEVGQDVHFIGGDFEQAIHEGVRQGYVEGLLRLSVVGDPLERKNTNDNTPAVIHTRIVQGDKVELMVAPKGFGSENMSRIKMFTPSATKEDIINFVVETAKLAGSNLVRLWYLALASAEILSYVLILQKKHCAVKYRNTIQKEEYRLLEREMLERVNQLDIDLQGFGGITTALSVAIEQYATHIAGLPVAVNVGCHVTRHKK